MGKQPMMDPMTQPAATVSLQKPSNEGVRVWLVRANESWAARLDPCLSEEEREDIQRLAREGDRLEAAVSRGLWRHAAGGMLGQRPSEVEVERTPYGRPIPAGLPRTEGDLSVSHASGLVALAAGSGLRVGVDLEHMYGLKESDGVAQAVEGITGPAMELMSDTAERQMVSWCIFESLIKADGRGLHLSAAMVTAEIRSLWGWNMARVAGTVWWVRRLRVPAGYIGAVSAMSPADDLDLVTLDDPGSGV